MKLNIEFLQTGGVPLTNDLMDNIMDAIKLYDVVGELAGHMTIIAGCDFLANSTTIVNPGVVAINGEILVFEGGAVTPNVFINEEQISKTFQDQNSKVLIKKRTVKFGNSTAPNLFVWADFKKLLTLKEMQIAIEGKASQTQVDNIEERLAIVELKTAPIENGKTVLIFMRPANEIPAGWKECIDLRGKTVVHQDTTIPDFATIWHPGGSKTKTIQKTNLPDLTTNVGIIHPYDGSNASGGFDGGSNIWKNKTISINPGGNSTPMDVMNPYRIVLFIEPDFN